MIMRDHELTDVILRAIQPEDENFLAEVYAHSRPDIALLPFDEEQKAAFARQQFELQHVHYQKYFPDADFDIILMDEEPVGRLYVDRTEKEIRVIDIALLPTCRGQGIGTRLMLRLINEATLLQRPLRLRVRPENPACQWYLKLGFHILDEDPANWHLEKLPGPILNNLNSQD